jgi:hypothetical protein
MVPNWDLAAMIVVPAGSREGRLAGDGDGDDGACADCDGSGEALPGDPAPSGADPAVEEVLQPTMSTQSKRTRLLMFTSLGRQAVVNPRNPSAVSDGLSTTAARSSGDRSSCHGDTSSSAASGTFSTRVVLTAVMRYVPLAALEGGRFDDCAAKRTQGPRRGGLTRLASIRCRGVDPSGRTAPASGNAS